MLHVLLGRLIVKFVHSSQKLSNRCIPPTLRPARRLLKGGPSVADERGWRKQKVFRFVRRLFELAPAESGPPHVIKRPPVGNSHDSLLVFVCAHSFGSRFCSAAAMESDLVREMPLGIERGTDAVIISPSARSCVVVVLCTPFSDILK